MGLILITCTMNYERHGIMTAIVFNSLRNTTVLGIYMPKDNKYQGGFHTVRAPHLHNRRAYARRYTLRTYVSSTSFGECTRSYSQLLIGGVDRHIIKLCVASRASVASPAKDVTERHAKYYFISSLYRRYGSHMIQSCIYTGTPNEVRRISSYKASQGT